MVTGPTTRSMASLADKEAVGEQHEELRSNASHCSKEVEEAPQGSPHVREQLSQESPSHPSPVAQDECALLRQQLAALRVEHQEALRRMECLYQEKDNMEVSLSKAWEEADQVEAVVAASRKELQDMRQESSD